MLNNKTRRGVATAALLFAIVLETFPSPGFSAEDVGALPLDIELRADGVRLLWTEANPPRLGSAEVARRPLAAGGDWTVLAPSLGAKNFYDDPTATAGTAWEYRVRRLGRKIIDQGYATVAPSARNLDPEAERAAYLDRRDRHASVMESLR